MVLTVLALLAASVAGSAHRPAAASTAPADVVPAAVAAYGGTGTIAVVVAPQQRPVTASGIRAARERAAFASGSWADNGEAAARPFPTASLVKLFVAEDLLHRHRSGAISLTDRDRALLQRMVSSSDDPAASSLWVRYGGPQMVRDVAARYQLAATTPPRVTGEWGETYTTARDLARFLSLLPTVAHPLDAATLLRWMYGVTPTAADGFDQRFGLLGAVAQRPAVKQGWMCCVGGRRHLHSVGLVGGRVVVLLSEVPRGVGYAAAREALTAAAAQIPLPDRPAPGWIDPPPPPAHRAATPTG
ncbi:class A beta-lactamase-related serine hydrolase [Geodermatophilus sp. YIM 151500]|uniref:class A beta-lactamase-related serine hydrolase n=1 Tax=Geodermatophilus sp. YIM 151500 TaxID=2984531 RepID=UPI0021E3F1EB|nr:class A beta-lactamase-related serine hydrolase [Geodermatophilus sp. YIM 151500]MCV2489075.1 class A beta-lactamase-related serine hydrolase [Geodermatophilus sp. YIM 151500]